MFSLERLFYIQKIINEKGSVRVAELSKILNVTEATIRSDLNKLEKEGKLIRNHGGALSLQFTNQDWLKSEFQLKKTEEQLSPHPERYRMYSEEKAKIAKKALEIIKPHDKIILDASSTTFYIAKAIPDDFPLTVLTNSVNVVVELTKKQQVEVISAGGTLSKNSMSYIGPVAESTIDIYNVDKAFLSCKGIHFESGITESNELQVLVKRKMMNAAEKVILLADHSKFGLKHFIHLAKIPEIDLFISDDALEEQYVKEFKNRGIQIELAGHDG